MTESSAARPVASAWAVLLGPGKFILGTTVHALAPQADPVLAEVVSGRAFIVAYVLMRAVKLTGALRVSEEGELEGLDIHEHGAPAYDPESADIGKGL